MAGFGTVETSDKQVFGNITITIKHRRQRTVRFRFWLAWFLMWLATRIGPCNYEWEEQEASDR